jgi:dUTP pyrophosphatase
MHNLEEIEKSVEKTRKIIQESMSIQESLAKGEYTYNLQKKVKIYSRGGEGFIPEYKTQGSSGLDVCAYLQEPKVIQPMEITLIPTGIYVDIPDDYEIQLRARSGTAYTKGITLINCIGTIDDDYVDEIKVAVINLSGKEQVIEPKERIAQMVFSKVDKLQWEIVDSPEDFNSKDRTGGFGSTGIK